MCGGGGGVRMRMCVFADDLMIGLLASLLVSLQSVSPSLLPSSSPRFRDDPELTRVLSIHQAVSALASTNASNYGLASRQIDRSLSNPLLLQLNNQVSD